MADVNSNGYTFIYAIIMTLLVAVSLALAAYGLKPMQQKSIELDKKRSILNAVTSIQDKAKIVMEYDSKIQEVVIDAQGNPVTGIQAFDIDMKKAYKMSDSERKMPLYVYDEGGKKKYIMPLHGAGLWDEIWGFVALEEDMNTIAGASFDHKGETPGLGAEITKEWFTTQFKGKQLANKGNFGLKILKGKNNDIKGKPFVVDGMSGATITGDGVQDMIEKGYNKYLPYLNKNKK